MSLEFRDVSEQIQPETVAIKSLSGGRFRVLAEALEELGRVRRDRLKPGL